jgi:hypothetical protein
MRNFYRFTVSTAGTPDSLAHNRVAARVPGKKAG